MLWWGGNNNLLCANCDVLCPGNHGLLCTGNHGLLRSTHDRVLSATTAGGRHHTRRLCPSDLRGTSSDLLCTCDIFHGLPPLVVSAIFAPDKMRGNGDSITANLSEQRHRQ